MTKKSAKDIEYEQQIGELTQDLQRVRADFENYRKNVDAEKARLVNVVKITTVMKMLPVVDVIEEGMKSVPEMAVVGKNLEKALDEIGVKKIDAKVGSEFNPETMEAIMSEGEGEKEVVSELLRAGYEMEGEVMRPAMVKVEKK